MKILVTGSSGLFGSRFVQLYSNSYELLTPSHAELDISDYPKVKDYVSANTPDVILHCAGLTTPTPAETERDNRNGNYWSTNVNGSLNLIKSINNTKIHFVHISTDMVFSGAKDDPGPYLESHPPEIDSQRLPWYGFTKAEAERLVTSTPGLKYSIVRMGKVLRSYSGSNFSGRSDYLSSPLKLYDQKELFPLIVDQYISITFADEAYKVILEIIANHLQGIFHVASPKITTPDQILSYYLYKARGVEYSQLSHMSLLDHPKFKAYPLRFPQFGGLLVERTQKKLGMRFINWDQIVDELIEQGIETV